MARKAQVLVVDDDADVHDLVHVAFALDDRFEVVGDALDGRAAVALAASLRPDLVLLDLLMPVMDGLTALPLIRRASPESAVVALSSDESLSIAAVVHGASGYVVKGAPLGQILNTLATALAGTG